MSQRNPMNERYTVDDRKGQTRKSASKAKPKTKAAASVRVEKAKKSPKEKKAVKKQEQQKRQQVERKYFNPPTAEYRKWRRIWWAALIFAVVMTAFSFMFRYWLPTEETISMVVLGLAYVGLVSALIIEFAKVKKMRKAYQAEMAAKIDKEARVEARKARSAAKLAEKTGSAVAEEQKEEVPAKNGLFNFSFLSRFTKPTAEEIPSEIDNAEEAKKSSDKK